MTGVHLVNKNKLSNQPAIDEPEVLIRPRDLPKYVPFGRTHIKRLCARGEFPEPFKIGPKAIAWKLSEIVAWQKAHLTTRAPQRQRDRKQQRTGK
jgi:predicted DNA-binding transcriptional regulator AlpA